LKICHAHKPMPIRTRPLCILILQMSICTTTILSLVIASASPCTCTLSVVDVRLVSSICSQHGVFKIETSAPFSKASVQTFLIFSIDKPPIQKGMYILLLSNWEKQCLSLHLFNPIRRSLSDDVNGHSGIKETRRLSTSTAATQWISVIGHHRPLAGTKLYCLATKEHGC